jgi:hypothetical protein
MRNDVLRFGVVITVFSAAFLPVRAEAPPGNSDVKALIQQLKDANEAVRLKAAKELGKLGRQARDAIPALTEAMQDDDADVRSVAKQALAKIRDALRGADPELRALRDELEQARRARAELERRSKEEQEDLRRKLEDERDRARKEVAQLRAAQAEVDRRIAELRGMEAKLKEREAQIVSLTNEARKLRDEVVASGITVKSLTERNMELLKQVHRLVADVDRLGGGKAGVPKGGADGANPPPAELRGTIRRVDKDNGLVVISLGTDAGLAKGHTLEVYRLDPPMYLGRVRVIEVRAHEAIAKPIHGLPGGRQPAFKEGDEVTSSLEGKVGEPGPAPKRTEAPVGKGTHVAIAGIIDIDRKGRDGTADFIKLLRGRDILIDAYINGEKGKAIGSITEKTDYLILGAIPEDGPAGETTARMVKDAARLGVTVIPLRRFLELAGFGKDSGSPREGK